MSELTERGRIVAALEHEERELGLEYDQARRAKPARSRGEGTT
jgi:hypothetical protein